MPIKIESKDITIKQIHDLFDYLHNSKISFTLHIETKD
jgi:hypothetical protein